MVRITEEILINTAARDFDPAPITGITPPHELAAAITADRHSQPRVSHLATQIKRLRPVELVWAVYGEAIGRPAEMEQQAGNCRRVGAKMNMDMINRVRQKALE